MCFWTKQCSIDMRGDGIVVRTYAVRRQIIGHVVPCINSLTRASTSRGIHLFAAWRLWTGARGQDGNGERSVFALLYLQISGVLPPDRETPGSRERCRIVRPITLVA